MGARGKSEKRIEIQSIDNQYIFNITQKLNADLMRLFNRLDNEYK